MIGGCEFTFPDLYDATEGIFTSYGQIESICCLQVDDADGGDGFTITIYGSEGKSAEITIQQNCMNFEEYCGFDENCKISDEGYELMKFLNTALVTTSSNNSSGSADFKVTTVGSPGVILLEDDNINAHDNYKDLTQLLVETIKRVTGANKLGFVVDHSGGSTVTITFENYSFSWSPISALTLSNTTSSLALDNIDHFNGIYYRDEIFYVSATATDPSTSEVVNLTIELSGTLIDDFPLLQCITLDQERLAYNVIEEESYSCELTLLGRLLGKAVQSKVNNGSLSTSTKLSELIAVDFQADDPFTGDTIGDIYYINESNELIYPFPNALECKLEMRLLKNHYYDHYDLSNVEQILSFQPYKDTLFSAIGGSALIAEVIFDDGTSGNAIISYECGVLHQCYYVAPNACAMDSTASSIKHKIRTNLEVLPNIDTYDIGSECFITIGDINGESNRIVSQFSDISEEAIDILYVGVKDQPAADGNLYTGYIVLQLDPTASGGGYRSIAIVDFTSTCPLGSCPDCAGNNLICNGDFEAMQDCYSTTESPLYQEQQFGTTVPEHTRIVDPTTYTRGAKTYGNALLAYYNPNSGSNLLPFWEQYVQLKPNTDYKLSMMFKGINGAEADVDLKVSAYDPSAMSSTTTIHISNWSIINNYIWTKKSVDFTTNSSEIWYKIELIQYGSSLLGYTLALDNISLKEDCSPDPSPFCGRLPDSDIVEFSPVDSCIELMNTTIETNARRRYNNYIEEKRKEFEKDYINHCLSNFESFTLNENSSEHHYTLYYYDEAGNLVRTIPPKGVNKITSASELEDIREDRIQGERTVYTNHQMATTYSYNSLNQLVEQQAPDQDDVNEYDTELSAPGVDPNFKAGNLSLINNYNGVMVGKNTGNNEGVIYYTKNGGNSWNKSQASTTNRLNDVQWMGSKKFVVGDGGFLLIKDGTTDWEERVLPTNEDLIKVYFYSASTGYVMSKSGKIWESTDGGENWGITPFTVLSSLLGNDEHIIDVTLSQDGSSVKGIAISSLGKIYSCSALDGVWIPSLHLAVEEVTAMSMSDGLIQFYASKSNNLLRVNGNAVLDLKSDQGGHIEKLHAKDMNNLTAVINEAGVKKLKYTTNGGQQWVNATASLTGDILDMYFSSADVGFCLTEDGTDSHVYKSTDAGQSWSSYGSSILGTTSYTLIKADGGDPYLIDPAIDQFLYYSGSAWTTFSAIGSSSIKDVKMFNLNSANPAGIAVMNSGEVYTYLSSSWSSPSYNSNFTITEYIEVMHMVSETDGYLIRNDGLIYSTDDGGATIDLLPLPGSVAGFMPSGATVEEVIFNEIGSNGIGMIRLNLSGESLILKSTDGGSHWSLVSNDIIPQLLTSVDYNANADKAFISGNNGALLISDNEGLSWKYLETGTPKVDLIDVDFDDNDKGGVIATNGEYYSYNLSSNPTLVAQTSLGSQLNQLDFQSGTTVLYAVVSGEPNVYFQGVQSTSLPSSITNGLNAIDGDGSGNYYAVGDNGTILYYDDVTTTWSEENTFIPPPVNGVFHINAMDVVAVGDGNTLLESHDGGKTWSTFKDPVNSPNSNFSDIHFTSSQHAVLVGDNGFAYEYDAARSPEWQAIGGLGVSNTFSDVHFYKDKVGAFVGNDGTAGKLYMTNGGTAAGFTNINPAGITDVIAVKMVDPQYGFALGLNSTTNRLITIEWDNTSIQFVANALTMPNVNGTVKSFDFIDRKVGYVVTDNGNLYKTDDGGQSWEDKGDISGNMDMLTAVAFTDRGKGIFAGEGGVSGKITDNSNRFSSRFYYDKLGRLVASQNPKQFEEQGSNYKYSYTLYDELGRTVESGQLISSTHIESVYNGKQLSYNAFENWANSTTKIEVSHTTYTETFSCATLPVGQGFLRNRVSFVTYEEEDDGNPCTYDHAMQYSYDPHGNVKYLVQDYPDLAPLDQQFKVIGYEYDLISGNVLGVNYQEGEADQFYHKYEYDADNRIQAAYTSTDKVHWDEDADYEYYRHGPLKRQQWGEVDVQGTDYAYTIHGWLKGVNANTKNHNRDIGKDALASSANPYFAEDAYGFTLGYYEDDYEDIGGKSLANKFEANLAGTDVETARSSLYNGNISYMSTALYNQAFDPAVNGPLAIVYGYDQLNRIKTSTSYTSSAVTSTNNWEGAVSQGYYDTYYNYDANGNLMQLGRKNEEGDEFDVFEYKYQHHDENNMSDESFKKKYTNKLLAVEDQVSIGTSYDIQEGQALNTTERTENNYVYDALGNLIRDGAENIDAIEWYGNGKIKSISRSGEFTEMRFYYDAMGNRIKKVVKPRPEGEPSPEFMWTTTYYVRDAQGNPLSTYELSYSSLGSGKYKSQLDQSELMIYGSDRLGLFQRGEQVSEVTFKAGLDEDKNFNNLNYFSPQPTAVDEIKDYLTVYRGKKRYELKNHLGNVLAVITDNKYPYIQSTLTNSTIFQNNFEEPVSDWSTTGVTDLNYEEGYMNVTVRRADEGIKRTIRLRGGVESNCTYEYCFTLVEPLPRDLYFVTYDAGGVLDIIAAESHMCVTLNMDQVVSIGFILKSPGSFTVDEESLTKSCTGYAFQYYKPVIREMHDYYPFGMLYPQRQSTGADGYRYGFQGQEKDDEIKGNGNSLAFKYRIHDPRLGRFLSIDPLIAKYPFYSPYAFSGNRVIDMIELEGLEPTTPKYKWKPSEVQEHGHGSIMKVDGYLVFLSVDNEGKAIHQYYNENSEEWINFEPVKPSCLSCELQELAQLGIENTVDYGGPVLRIAAGIVAVAAAIPTGGASLSTLGALGVSFGITVGTYSAASGAVELTMNITNKKELAEKIPSGFLNATVGLTVKTMVDDKEVVEYMEFGLNVVEGAATMKFDDPSQLQKFSNIITSGNMTIESIDIIEKNSEKTK